MRMRKKDKIDLWQLVDGERRRGQSFWTNRESRQTNSDAREKHGIGENCDAENIDEHRRVPKPDQRDLRVAPLCRLGLGKGQSNRAPGFNRPLAEKMTEPPSHWRAVQRRLFGSLHAKNVTQPSWPQRQQAGKPARRIRQDA